MAVNPNQSYINPDTPYFGLASGGGSIGPNIVCSTISVNDQIQLSAGAGPGFPGGIIRFNKIGDPDDIMAEISHQINPLGDVAKELILIDDLLDQYQPFSVGNLRVYGAGGVVGNPPVLSIREEKDEVLGGPKTGIALLDADLVAMSAGRISSLFVSSINNAAYPPPAVIPPNLTLSTLYASSIASTYVSTNNLYFVNASGNFLSTNQITTSSINFVNASGNFLSTNQIVTRNINTSSINGGNLFISTTSGGSALFSSLVTANISSVFGDFTFNLISTLAFNPSLGGVNLGGVNLGMGGFLGGLVGGIGSGLFNTIVAGAALTTGIIALTNSRGSGQINSSNYEMVNTTTQLQVSTLGQSTIRYLRLVSSIIPNQVPGTEFIVSTIIPAGATCIRSLSDPVNLANASTARSTIISFGSWVPLPTPPTPAPENVSTISFASISSLTVSSINGFSWSNLPGGGGGGGGGFDFTGAMQELSTIIQWSDQPFNRIIAAQTNDLSNISTGFLTFITGNNSATTAGSSNNNGIINFRLIPQAFGFGQYMGGEHTIGSGLTAVTSSILTSTLITLRNNTAVANVANAPALLEVMQTGAINAADEPNILVYKDYGNVAVNNLFFSSMTSGVNNINGVDVITNSNNTGLQNINVNAGTFVVNSNNNAGMILAPQAAPSFTCNINYHNIGGCLLGYYGQGTAYLGGGFQTALQANVYNGGVQMSNGYLNASPGIGQNLASRINNNTFDVLAGMGGILQSNAALPNGSNFVGPGIWRPGVYLCQAGTASNATSATAASIRYLYAYMQTNGQLQFQWQIAGNIEGNCYWNIIGFPSAPPGAPLVLFNTTGSAQPFYWSISGLNYLN